jgi:SEC-C motif-containing protein
MRSRYSAYALNLPDYIIATTHPNNPDFTTDTARWRAEITAFCTQTEFRGLTILDVEADKSESYVTFRAKLSTGDMIERSRFVYEEGRWWYVDGEVEAI